MSWEVFDDCFNFLAGYWPVQVFYSCFGFGSLWFPEMRPFLQDCLIYWRIAAYSKFLKCFYFLGIDCNLSSFIHYFINLDLFYF